MSAWPQGKKPVSREEQVFAQYQVTDLPAMQAAAQADREIGHEPIPLLVELVEADGKTLRYEVVDGPRCDHRCAKCRDDIEIARGEFGTGAIGAFADSSGGEMERLRKELRALAGVMQKTLAPINQRLEALEAAHQQKALPEK